MHRNRELVDLERAFQFLSFLNAKFQSLTVASRALCSTAILLFHG